MVMTLAEFTEVIQMVTSTIARAFYTFDQTKVFEDGGVQVSLLDIMVGMLILTLIIDRMLVYLEED